MGQIANELQRRPLARHRRDTPGPDVLRAGPAPTVGRPGIWKPPTDGSEQRHLLADEGRAVDAPAALSLRRGATRVALTRPTPAVRPLPSPAQPGCASHRPARRQATSSGHHRSRAPVRGGFERPRRAHIAVLVPAHNEQDYIGATIEGIQAQTRPADRIIVVPNNCRDDDQTAAVAAKYDGVEVIELHGITGRKAGALNAALDAVLPELAEDDLVVCMDADTVIHRELLENAERHFQDEPGLGAVSSNHLIKRFGTVIELLQAMEYERDRRFIGRRKGRFGCMTGMAAMYRVAALRDVKRAYGEVYDPDNWTEDWKLTIALKHLRWGMVRPQDCLATTVPVSDVRGLFLQRERWARGYIQTLSQFGLTRWTTIPWAKQAGLVWSVVARIVLLYLLWTVRGHLLAWWCLPVLIVLISDSVNTAHKAGWRAILVALAFPVEMAYAWLITAAIASGYWKQLTQTGKNDTWKMVRR
ncbi:MAG: glycosyltransferase family 2 protein [Streptosporangiaceae bacterium]